MPTSAASDTRIWKPFTPKSNAAGRRLISGRGGGAPAPISRHTAAAKQKALNRIRTVPVAVPSQGNTTSLSNARADAGRERCQPGSHPGGVGPLTGEDRPVRGKLGASIGAVDLLNGAVLQLAGALRQLRVCLIGVVRGGHQSAVTVMRCQAVER